jgi:hypothetical protein
MKPENFFTALGALAAAAVSIVALYYSLRKDRRSWSRSALEQAFVDFLTASYDHRDACKNLALLAPQAFPRSQGLKYQQWLDRTADYERWRAAADASHETMVQAATRFRVLASDVTAQIALDLHENNDHDWELLEAGNLEQFNRTKDERREAFIWDRDRFVQEAQMILEISTPRRLRQLTRRRRARARRRRMVVSARSLWLSP